MPRIDRPRVDRSAVHGGIFAIYLLGDSNLLSVNVACADRVEIIRSRAGRPWQVGIC